MNTSIEPLISSWHPMSDPVDVKIAGKLLEELGELTSAIARSLIQGIDECEPVSFKDNRDWVEDEVADVLAGIELLTERWKLDRGFIQQRSKKKQEQLVEWHKQA